MRGVETSLGQTPGLRHGSLADGGHPPRHDSDSTPYFPRRVTDGAMDPVQKDDYNEISILSSVHAETCEMLIGDMEGSRVKSSRLVHGSRAARVVELADTQDLGSCAARRGGSTPPSRISRKSTRHLRAYVTSPLPARAVFDRTYPRRETGTGTGEYVRSQAPFPSTGLFNRNLL